MRERSGLRSLLVAVFAAAVVLATPAVVSAAPADALTERASPADKEHSATDYASKTNQGCAITRHAPTLSVVCGRNEYVSFSYEFRVPGKSIRFRAKVPVAESGSGANSFFGYEGYRTGARGYTLHVGMSGRGRWEFAAARVMYRLPTAFNKRPCVTRGEWARMSPWEGGFSGTLKKYAAVFETNGKQRKLSAWTHGFRYQVRAYKACGTPKMRRMTFHQYRGTPGWWAYWG